MWDATETDFRNGLANLILSTRTNLFRLGEHQFKNMFSNLRLITVVSCSFFLLGSAFGQRAAIEVEVKGVDGRPSKAAEVRIERQDKKTRPLIATTDQRGRLTANELENGTYKLTAVVEGGIQSSQIVKTQANKPLRVAFDMRNTPAVTSKPKKRYVWVQAETGTRIGGHWVEADENVSAAGGPSARNIETLSGRALEHAQYGSGTAGGGR